jgi:hypothetical protein
MHQIRRAHSCAKDAREAVREFSAAAKSPEMALVAFFCSSDYCLDAVADEMRQQFGETQVVGCTTAGEIGPSGYREHSIAGASFPACSFSATSGRLQRLQEFDLAGGHAFAESLLQETQTRAPTEAWNWVALQLIDGLSIREEPVTRAFQHALDRVPLVGGSAANSPPFGKTFVYHEGSFHTDSTVLTLIGTFHPIQPFLTQHFVASEQRVVVTDADPENRLVREIDGRPAAEAYAELVGVPRHKLDPVRFAESPMVVTIGGTHYVRSISEALPDGSMRFFCAIDEGMVLRAARGQDLVNNLEQTFASIRHEIGEPQLTLGCDCVLRRFEILQEQMVDRVDEIMRRNRVVGFNTFGEQYRGLHVNQTFAGIAIGTAEESVDG